MQRAPVKLQQKIWGLSKVLIPHLLYPLVIAASAKGQLQRGDQEIQRFVHSTLHQPKDTPVRYCHTACAEGGWAFLLWRLIPHLQTDLQLRLASLGNKAVHLAVEVSGGVEQDSTTP